MGTSVKTGSLQAAPASGADNVVIIDGVAMQAVRDRRAPAAWILFLLLLCFVAAMGAVAWYSLRSTNGQQDVATAQAAQRITRARQAFENAPVLADPQKIPVGPVALRDLSREEARLLNASIPFSKDLVPRATPMILPLSGIDSARATDCMAAALWYEAGDDAVGERAVAQVVLNRVRHPAFPNTVCGVVFQGSERRTGCQFSFTCDGAMRRLPSAAAWARAREIATGALAGLVFAPVGYATHYHTDWVAPYWSAKVDKIAQIGTHLFFRWTGAAGRPAAFSSRYAGGEPAIASLAALSSAHAGAAGAALGAATTAVGTPIVRLDYAVTPGVSLADQEAVSPAMLRGNKLLAYDDRRNIYDVGLTPGVPAGAMALMALELCGREPSKPCTVRGRIDAMAGQQDNFYYYNDKARNYEVLRWDCRRFARSDPAQCMPGTITP